MLLAIFLCNLSEPLFGASLVDSIQLDFVDFFFLKFLNAAHFQC